MSFVQTKCPNCGGEMTYDNNQFKCEYCGSRMFRIVDAKINADIETITAEEFSQKLERGKRNFIVNINNRFEAFDITTKVINKKLQDAEAALKDGKYSDVEKYLTGVDENILAAERLKFLARYEAVDEYELSFRAVDIRCDLYDRIMSHCDEETKKTYEKIVDTCLMNEEIAKEIDEGNRLFDVGLLDDALTYANEMVTKYPQKVQAWQFRLKIIYVKLTGGTFPITENDISMRFTDTNADTLDRAVMLLKQCPDYAYRRWYSDGDIVDVVSAALDKYKFDRDAEIRHRQMEHDLKMEKGNYAVWTIASCFAAMPIVLCLIADIRIIAPLLYTTIIICIVSVVSGILIVWLIYKEKISLNRMKKILIIGIIDMLFSMICAVCFLAQFFMQYL